MHQRAFATALVYLLALCASAGIGAQTNGPMSSGYKPAAPAVPGASADTAVSSDAKGANGQLDVRRLFANTCGWCHSNGGRAAGKGPKLMGTTLTDAEIASRIKLGKPGAMPAFGSAFSAEDIQAIVRYIRELKDEG
jgi:mono/diheme cytochrome c family protein